MSAKKNKQNPSAGTPKTESAAKPVVQKTVKQDSVLTTVFKEEMLVWMLTILCSLIVYIVVANIVHGVYNPDINSLKETANKLLVDAGSVRPEPGESMLFRVGVVVILLSLLGFYKLFSGMKALKEQASKPFFTFLGFLCIAVIACLIYMDFAADNFFASGGSDTIQNARDMHQDIVDNKAVSWGASNFDFFFHGLFLGNYFLLYTFILVPAIAVLFFMGVKKYGWGENKMVSMGVNIICGAVIFAVVVMHTFNFPYTFENKYDFNAVYYSMTQVYAGLPLLVNGFTNTYGLYPEFLNPIFHLTGLSVFTFSFVMATLLGAAFAFNFYVLRRFTENKFILLAGFLTVVFFPFLDFKFVTAFDCIFALFPVRYIIPSTLAFLATLYFSKRSKGLYWTTFAIMGCFVLWNPEIGMVCYLCWMVANIYNDFYDAEGRIAVKKLGLHLLVALGSIVVVVFGYKLVIYLVYGSFPDLSLLFGAISVFGKIGFNMLPMVLVHPWNLSVIILVLGFTYAISKWYKKQITPKATMVLLISLLGLGYFVYFQGRSHNWPFAYSSSFTLILLTILGDGLWTKAKEHDLLPVNALFVVFLFVISFSFFEVAYGAGKIKELMSQDDDKSNGADEQQRIEGNIDFIQKNSREKEKILVFSAAQYQGLYFGGSKRIAAFNPGFMDMFFKSDLNRLVDIVADSSANIFIEPSLANFPYMVRPLGAMAATYEVKTTNKTMAMLSKRTTKIPAASFFGNGEEQVFHEKYTDDTTGIKARMDDALGTKPVALNPAFSVEVLFNSKPQVYPYATLVGNMDDSSGFIIANVINSPNYFFGINGKGSGMPVPNNDWVYCVMNVFPDHVELYLDGNLASTTSLASPMRQSHQKLCVGNLGYMRYYVGAIAEVAVFNKPLDKSQVAATWEQIKGGIGRN